MKKFTFKFEKILQVRIDKENTIRNNLGKVNKLIQDKEFEKNKIQGDYTNFLTTIDQNMKKGIRASELQSISYNKAYLIDKIEKLSHELEILYEQRHMIQKDLIEANKQRKVMEKLKEKELENYKAMEAQEEAKVVDQIVTYQSTKKRGE